MSEAQVLDWADCTLADCFRINSGSAPGRFRNDAASVPLMGANGPIGACSTSNFGPGYIVGRVGAAGAITRVQGRVWASDNALTLEPKGAVDGYFAHYLLLSAKPWELATVTAQPLVTQSNLGSLRVLLPGYEEQRVIAQILDTLDTAIRATEALIDKLKAVKQGLLHDLLTRGIDANGELRPPQSEAPQLYKESPLGWIPREWECAALAKRLARITYGFTSPMPTTDEGPWMLTATDVSDSRILYEQARHTTERAFRLLSAKSRPNVGDVLVTKDGTLGRVAVLDRDNVCVNQSVAVLSPKTGADSSYLATYLQSPVGQERMLADSGGSTIKHLYISKLAEMSIPWPEEHETEAIVSRISGMTARLENEESLLSKLNRQKSGLMDDLLTGRVRVTPLLKSVQQAVAPIVQQPVGQTGA